MPTCDKMVPEVTIQHVASFQIFIRDNKPKMNVCYPFLSQEQILCKLRDQWKKLDDSKRQPYSKLVLTKKKTVKTTKVKVVKITRCRTPKVKQTKTLKRVEISRSNNGDEDNFGFSNVSDDSYIDNECELDSASENSPFMRNKFAIESLNSSFCPATYKPTESVKKRSGGKTYGGSVFGLQKCVSKVRPESMDNSRTGILQKQCKNRRIVQGHVSFSTVQETVHNNNCYESNDEDLDEVLLIESNTENKTDISSGNTCRNKTADVKVPCRINLQQVEDHYLRSGCLDTSASKYNPAVGELRVADSTKQKLNAKTADKNVTVISSESTPSRFSERIRKMSPDYIFGTLCGRSLLGDSNVYLNKKPKVASEYCKKETFSVTNNMSAEKRSQPFCFESPNLSAEVKVQSCIRDGGNVLSDVRGNLHRSNYKNGTFGNFKPEHKIKNELKSKAAVNRNSLSGKYGTCISDCRTNECVSSRAVTHSHKLLVFDSPETTKSCVKSKEQNNDSSYLKSAVNVSQKVTSNFIGKDTDWKDGERFRVSDEESDYEFGNSSSLYQNDTVRKAPCHGVKSADEANFKTNIRKKSENMKSDVFIRESNILKRKIDDSDKENDNEFGDKDGWYKNNTVKTEVCQTRKKINSAVETYPKEGPVNKWEHIPFDFCGKESDINRTNVNRRGEEKNREVNSKDSLLTNNVDPNILCYRNKENTYKTYSKRNTFNEAERTISHVPGKAVYNHSKDGASFKECAEERNEFDNVASYDENGVVKKAPCPKSRDTSRRQDDLHPLKENNYYQINRITDPGAVFTNNTTEKCRRVSKGKILDKCEQLKHETTKIIKNQVSDMTSVKQKSEMDIADVKHKYSRAENGFLKKYPQSIQKQAGKSKTQNQKKSMITQRSTSLNRTEEHGKNKVKRLPAFASDYTEKASCILPVSLESETVHQGSLLNNSSTKQYKHTEEFGGGQSPLCKETPNLDVRKFSSDFSKGSVMGLQRRLFPEVGCRNTSNIDCRKNYKMNCRNVSTMDCRNTSNSDCINTSNIDCKNPSNRDCRSPSNKDCRTNYKIDCRHTSTTDNRNKPQISLKAEDVYNSDAESETSDNSLGSETEEDEEKTQDNFLINMAGQTTSALLQAIDRLKSLTSPQMNFTDKDVHDGAPSGLPEPRNKCKTCSRDGDGTVWISCFLLACSRPLSTRLDEHSSLDKRPGTCVHTIKVAVQHVSRYHSQCQQRIFDTCKTKIVSKFKDRNSK